jgi:7-carboxy-7-deazaguanine synthase
MRYAVKEIYFTLQGEGSNSGRPAVLCRFAGCNLWNGRDVDREAATCKFCDTDFRGTDGPGGGSFNMATELRNAILSHWPDPEVAPFVVFTGGEPALQLDPELMGLLHDSGALLAIETNGTLPLPDGLDWICVSPKRNAPLAVTEGDELKLIHPQDDLDPASYLSLSFKNFFLQPMDGPDYEASLAACLSYCLRHPQWRLSLQTHKTLNIR